MIHAVVKCSTEGVQYSMEVSNIPRREENDSRRYGIFHGGG